MAGSPGSGPSGLASHFFWYSAWKTLPGPMPASTSRDRRQSGSTSPATKSADGFCQVSWTTRASRSSWSTCRSRHRGAPVAPDDRRAEFDEVFFDDVRIPIDGRLAAARGLDGRHGDPHERARPHRRIGHRARPPARAIAAIGDADHGVVEAGSPRLASAAGHASGPCVAYRGRSAAPAGSLMKLGVTSSCSNAVVLQGDLPAPRPCWHGPPAAGLLAAPGGRDRGRHHPGPAQHRRRTPAPPDPRSHGRISRGSGAPWCGAIVGPAGRRVACRRG